MRSGSYRGDLVATAPSAARSSSAAPGLVAELEHSLTNGRSVDRRGGSVMPFVSFAPGHDLALTEDDRRLVLEVCDEREAGSTYGVRQHVIDWKGPGLVVYRRLQAAFEAANATYRVPLDSMDRVAVAVYGEGEGLPWHRDDRERRGDRPDSSGVVLGLVAILSDDHTGGALTFLVKGQPIAPPQPAGTILVFPSGVPHRVTPVESGERRSLIAFGYRP
jgi:PKHD-type hydroxylase